MGYRWNVWKYNNEMFIVRFGRRAYYTKTTREAAQELADRLNKEQGR